MTTDTELPEVTKTEVVEFTAIALRWLKEVEVGAPDNALTDELIEAIADIEAKVGRGGLIAVIPSPRNPHGDIYALDLREDHMAIDVAAFARTEANDWNLVEEYEVNA